MLQEKDHQDRPAVNPRLVIIVLLSLLVLLSYRGVVANGFVNYDDPAYVLENRHVQEGLTREGLVWAFTATWVSNWHPLTWLSLMLDHDLYGLNAAGYHVTSVVLHWLAGLVLFLTLARMTGRLWCSGLCAGLFLVHPLHVESVAWVAERKDVLCGLFWMLGMWGYARYAERRVAGRYAWVLLFFVLALLSKPMAVTFPFVLLLLDYWPLGRMAGGVRVSILPLVWEKVPLLALSAASSAVTFWVQKDWNAVASLAVMPLSERLLHIPVVYATYLKMAFWPVDLSAFYPYHGPPGLWTAIAVLMGLLSATLLFLWLSKGYPLLVMGWFWYLGTLVPVIGLVQVGSQAMADRYTYLPLVGIFMMVSFLPAGRGALPYQGKILPVAVILSLLAPLVMLTQERVRQWRNSETLYADALAKTRENYLAHYLLGMAEVERRNPTAAMDHYRKAVRIRPSFVQAQNGLGHLLMAQGCFEEASNRFEKALAIQPGFVPAMKNMAHLAMQQGLTDRAITYYREALTREKEDAELYNNYGVALFMKGDRDKAIWNMMEALRLKPDYTEARDNLRKIHQGK
jgi:Tfp pilus assembly protein PilF